MKNQTSFSPAVLKQDRERKERKVYEAGFSTGYLKAIRDIVVILRDELKVIDQSHVDVVNEKISKGDLESKRELDKGQ